MEKNLSLTTQCVSIDEKDNAWIFSNEFNALFQMKLDTNELRYVKSFEEEEFFCASLYTDCVHYKQKLVFIPCCAKKIAIYDTETEIVKYIAIRDETYVINFNTVLIDETRVLLYPVVYSKKAYILNMKYETCETIQLDYGKYEQQFSYYIDKPLMCGKACLKNKAYFVVYGSTKYISLDLQTYRIDVHQHQEYNNMYAVTSNMNKLDFLFMDGSAILSLTEDNEDRCIIPLFQGIKKDVFSDGNLMTYTVIHPISSNEYLCLPLWNNPLCIATIYKYDLIHIDWERIKPVTGEIQPFAIVKKSGSDILIFPYESNTLIKINQDTKEISYNKLKIGMQEYKSIIEILIDNRNTYFGDGLLYEANLSLELYLRCIAECSTKTNSTSKNEFQVGKKIYNEILKSLY